MTRDSQKCCKYIKPTKTGTPLQCKAYKCKGSEFCRMHQPKPIQMEEMVPDSSITLEKVKKKEVTTTTQNKIDEQKEFFHIHIAAVRKHLESQKKFYDQIDALSKQKTTNKECILT